MAADHPSRNHNSATNDDNYHPREEEQNGHLTTNSNGLSHDDSNDDAILENGKNHQGSNQNGPQHNHRTPQQTRSMASRPRLLSLEEIKETNDSLLPLDRFSEWIYCIALVTFDIEVGQAIEVKAQLSLPLIPYHNKERFPNSGIPILCFSRFQKIYPPHIRLTEREVSMQQSNITYL